MVSANNTGPEKTIMHSPKVNANNSFRFEVSSVVSALAGVTTDHSRSWHCSSCRMFAN
jgi:hypothetical protein